MSDNFPTRGVDTAPAIKYAVRIHAVVLYGILKSWIKSGIAGIIIVSPYTITSPIKLSIANVIQASLDILSRYDVVIDFSLKLFLLLLDLLSFSLLLVMSFMSFA